MPTGPVKEVVSVTSPPIVNTPLAQSIKVGERSNKFVLEYIKKPGLFIEIQAMTQLQEAWDKKDHFLVYEKRRGFSDKDEEIFPDFLDAKMFATAELLFVADEYFEQLRNAREDKNETT